MPKTVEFLQALTAQRNIALIGRSGAGKSTLLNRLRKGELGTAWSTALIPQDIDASLNPHISCRRIINATGTLDENQLSLLGLDASMLDKKPGQLSGGQRARVAVARAVATGAKAILADEALSCLDQETAALVADYLRQMPSPVIMVTHNLDYAVEWADDWFFIEKDGENIGLISEHGHGKELWELSNAIPARRSLVGAYLELEGRAV
ncbi:MAG: ATP-binding cassette domain-containing protein [Corynebacterium sp.]|nr:ATP-binding cassette domain-containing protein [Corynebacterium sp.]